MENTDLRNKAVAGRPEQCRYAEAEFFLSPSRLESHPPVQGERGKPRLRSTRCRAIRAGRKMWKQHISAEDAFLDSISFLILADDRSGKEVEKFLKMCNRLPAGIGVWNENVQFIIKKLAGPFQSG